MSEQHALVLIAERIIDFYGDPVQAARIERDGERRAVAPARPLCALLGLDWSSQRQRIMHERFSPF